jgi:hypothetical protein
MSEKPTYRPEVDGLRAIAGYGEDVLEQKFGGSAGVAAHA